MIKKYLSFALCCLLWAASNSSLVSAQTKITNDDSSVAKIKAIIVKRGYDKNRRVKVKMLDGTRLRGDVGQTGEDSFTLTDAKTGQKTSIAYRDVSQVERSNLSKGDKIALGIAIGAAVTAAVVAISIFTIICRNEGNC